MIQINNRDGDPIIYISNSSGVEFTKQGELIKEVLTKSGIHIPFNKQQDFSNRKIIYYKDQDPLVAKAIIEVYFPSTLRESGFTLTIKAEP
jgi:hypothetical protein